MFSDKEFYKNGKVKFDGEYLDGKRWNGVGYNPDSNTDGNPEYKILEGKGHVREYNDGNYFLPINHYHD